MANQTAPELAEEDSNLKDTYKTDRSSSVATSSNTGKDDFQNDDGHHNRSGQGWGRGIILDIKRTLLTHWKGEMTNLNR
eukprot:scaffold41616_cov66-Cyclotella_meneghiniana.AAC.1